MDLVVPTNPKIAINCSGVYFSTWYPLIIVCLSLPHTLGKHKNYPAAVTAALTCAIFKRKTCEFGRVSQLFNMNGLRMHPIKTPCCHRHGVSISQRSHVQYRPLCRFSTKGEQIFTKLDKYKLREEFLAHQPNTLHLTHFPLHSLHHGRLHMRWKLEMTTAALDHILIISSGRQD